MMGSKKQDRQDGLLAELGNRPSARLGDFAAQFGVSKETIRRDISELSERGLVARTYGGALPVQLGIEPVLNEREGLNVDARRRMAAVAAGLIADCRVLMIDTGSTMAPLCERLARTVPRSGSLELTVITNGIKNLQILAENPSIRGIACPGVFDAGEAAMFGSLTLEFLAGFHAQAFVTSASGIDGERVTDAHAGAAATKRTMMRQAGRSIFVGGANKHDVVQFETVCGVGQFDAVVTDVAPRAELAAAWADAGVTLHVAG